MAEIHSERASRYVCTTQRAFILRECHWPPIYANRYCNRRWHWYVNTARVRDATFRANVNRRSKTRIRRVFAALEQMRRWCSGCCVSRDCQLAIYAKPRIRFTTFRRSSKCIRKQSACLGCCVSRANVNQRSTLSFEFADLRDGARFSRGQLHNF